MKEKTILLLVILFVLFYHHTFIYGYSDELHLAYTWAFNNWITTQNTIDKANVEWEITRIELSKMISNYVIKVLKKYPDTSKICNFSDITENLDNQYDNWVTKSCQLWLMWQWITNFRPYDKVSRAEFWTILSRVLYWEKYNWWNPYYKKHLNQLNIVWIMKNITNSESRKEIRWYVMLTLMRSENILSKDNHKEVGNNVDRDISLVKLKDDFYVKSLWALNDHWIADKVWFYDFFWSYFDKDGQLPSMFSCEDIATNSMKENHKNNCLRYEIWNDKYSFLILWEPKLKVKEWIIMFWDSISISEYSLGNNSFEDVIKNSKEWLDSEKYCLKKHSYSNHFSHNNKYWIAGLWGNLNLLNSNWNLFIYDIHKKLWDWTCGNNIPWIVTHINNSNYYNVIISYNDTDLILRYDGYYSTPFSVDIK